MNSQEELKNKILFFDKNLREEFGVEIYAYDVNKYRFFIKIIKRTMENINLPLIPDSMFSYVHDGNFHSDSKYNRLYFYISERCELDYKYKVNYCMYPYEYSNIQNEIFDVDEIMYMHDITLEKCLIISNLHYSIKLLTGIHIMNCYFMYINKNNLLLFYFDKRRLK